MRTFGRKGWQVSDVGHGTWGMGDWAGRDDARSLDALQHSLEQGCNFYDSAWSYGYWVREGDRDPGHSDRLVGQLIKNNPDRRIYAASKIPPATMDLPAPSGATLAETYPRKHVLARAEEIRENLGVETIDVLQFHTWDDAMQHGAAFAELVLELKEAKFCDAIGVSVNAFDAKSGIRVMQSGLIDSVQVVYNVFTQDSDDGLFAACEQCDVALIARVPFDEGSLTGQFTRDWNLPNDYRRDYFSHGNFENTMDRVEMLRAVVPEAMTMAEMALAFILSKPQVTTVIAGMRTREHVDSNLRAVDIELDPELLELLRAFRWERDPHAPFA